MKEKAMWCVRWSGMVYHDVVVDADNAQEAKELAAEHFDDNDDYYGDDGVDLKDGGHPNWFEEPDGVEQID